MEHVPQPYTALVPRTDRLVVQKVGHTALVTIDNPPANTWDSDMLHGLVELVAHLNDDPDIYAMVITGRGRRFFSAGADLKLFVDGDRARARSIARLFGNAFEALRDFSGVTIAAINGYAMGGGLECALACDIRIAERQAQLGLPEASVGLLPCAGGTQALAWLVGEGWAKRMILCGERVDGVKAERIGLVEEVVEEGLALPTALRLAAQVARNSPRAVRLSKELIQAGRNQPINSVLPRERELFGDLFDFEDTREGVAAFFDRRPPRWTNH
jgi:enoyl-CoA hydratase/carnithine racemase